MAKVDDQVDPNNVARFFTHTFNISDSPRRSLDVVVDANERLSAEQLDVMFKCVFFIVGPTLDPEKFGPIVFDFDQVLSDSGLISLNSNNAETLYHITDEVLD